MENLKQLAAQIKWQLIILQRNNLIGISVVVTFFYAAIFYLFKDFPFKEKVLTLLLFNDPSLIGLMFFGLAVILEKNQQVLPVFFVSPISLHHYLLSRVLSLSIVAWACSFGMAISALGFSFQVIHFSIGVFAVSFIFSLGGILLISYVSEFLAYMLFSIPIMLFLSLPLLNYYELTNVLIFNLIPTQGATNLIIGSYGDSLSMMELAIAYVSTFFWSIGLYFGVYKVFNKQIKEGY